MATEEAASEVPLYPWHATVLKLLPNLNGKRVLEVGCGRGDFARLLATRYPEASITATDFSDTAIELARSKAKLSANVNFLVADAQALPFDADSFDMMISCECLEHVESPPLMLSSMARCLVPGGEFVLTTENYFNGMLLAWLKAVLKDESFNSGSGVQPRENFFLFWRVRRMIEAAGLTITHMESNHFVWLLLPRFDPDTFFTADIKNTLLKKIFRPFGRHFTYVGSKRSA